MVSYAEPRPGPCGGRARGRSAFLIGLGLLGGAAATWSGAFLARAPEPGRVLGPFRAAWAAAIGPVPAAAAGTSAPSSAHGSMTYGSWGSGFVADAPAGGAFTSLSTRFIAPPAPAHVASGWVAIWGGIGLSASGGDQLMQAGVSMQSTAAGTWDASIPWWINEPSTPTVPNVMTVGVAPGDTVEVDLGQITATSWGFRVTDVTTGATAYGSCTDCASRADTAAWIVEDPTASSGSGQTGYADPAEVQFLSASAAINSGPSVSLSALDWHPLLRAAGTAQQGPAGSAPAAGGGFTVVDLP